MPVKMHIAFILPFVGILLCIAIIPLVNGNWWRHNFQKVAAFWGLPMAAAMFFILRDKTIQTGVEFLSFIALVGSLFVISGGILIKGTHRSSPLVNAVFFAIGAALANMIGTAGASMVLIRPLLRINETRKHKIHIFIFFIFVVGNIGGSLTPLGDPPLFLGFLQGVPFAWTLTRMFPAWLFNVAAIIAVYCAVDAYIIGKLEGGVKPLESEREPIRILGGVNFIFLFGVLCTVLLYGYVISPLLGHIRFLPEFCQIALMAGMAALSLKFTPGLVREANGFTWFPVREVAILFAAIFACMIPALNILEYLGATGGIKVTHAWQYFWMSGGLSSFLDNAPTYLTFLSLGKTVGGAGCVAVLGGCAPQKILLAVSMGSVFMGANSYIGNAPNFMVKSICEESGTKMPSFFGYMAWSTLVLIPLFIADTLLFFRG